MKWESGTRKWSLTPFVVFAAVGLLSFAVIHFENERKFSKNEHMVLAMLWFQHAGEARALMYQAYNVAKMRLEMELAKGGSGKPKALIVDIDETVLDNGPYDAKLILTETSYPTGWFEWVSLAQAEPIPGALEFLKYADSEGVQIFYVTNRKLEEGPATKRNLIMHGFPQVADDRLLLRDKDDGKEERRKKVAAKYDIVMLVGDNLNDFTDAYDKKSVSERLAEVDRMRNEWGKKFIVLPNPVYGDWEGALYGYNWRMSEVQKDSIRKKFLKAY
jgi:5'-nucleotidase (lipoprotein e(P4) family)